MEIYFRSFKYAKQLQNTVINVKLTQHVKKFSVKELVYGYSRTISVAFYDAHLVLNPRVPTYEMTRADIIFSHKRLRLRRKHSRRQ